MTGERRQVLAIKSVFGSRTLCNHVAESNLPAHAPGGRAHAQKDSQAAFGCYLGIKGRMHQRLLTASACRHPSLLSLSPQF